LRICAKLLIEARGATAKDQLVNQSPKDKDIVSNSLPKSSEAPSQMPRSPGLDPTPERGHENGHGGSASHGTSANSISPASSSQSWLQKSDEPKKGLGLQLLQNLWDDEEAEAAKKSPKMTIEERGSRLRVAERSRGAASRTSSISSVTSQRSSALATSVEQWERKFKWGRRRRGGDPKVYVKSAESVRHDTAADLEQILKKDSLYFIHRKYTRALTFENFCQAS
jgi:hypothetical protein